MSMKKWPEDGDIVSAEELLNPLRKLLQEAMDKGDLVYEQGLSYDGYNVGSDTLATCFDPEEAFQAERLRYSHVSQGHDVFERILLTAFQLGFEQGKRHLAKDPYKLIHLLAQQWDDATLLRQVKFYAEFMRDPEKLRETLETLKRKQND